MLNCPSLYERKKMDTDIQAVAYFWFAIVTMVALVPPVAFSLYLFWGGEAQAGGWSARIVVTLTWALLIFGAIIAGLPDSVIIFAFILGMVMIVRAYTPLVEAVRLARRADRDAAWWRHVRQ